jgi:hypothetical protein
MMWHTLPYNKRGMPDPYNRYLRHNPYLREYKLFAAAKKQTSKQKQ